MRAGDVFLRSSRLLRRLGFVVEGYARNQLLITELCASSYGARGFVVLSGHLNIKVKVGFRASTHDARSLPLA